MVAMKILERPEADSICRLVQSGLEVMVVFNRAAEPQLPSKVREASEVDEVPLVERPRDSHPGDRSVATGDLVHEADR